MGSNGAEMSEKVNPKTVVFAVCATCQKEIIRGEKRKLVNSSWNHLSCFTPQNNANAEALLAQLSQMLKPQASEGVTIEEVEAIVEEQVKALALPKVLEIRQENKPPVKLEKTHYKFEKLLYWVSKRKHCYLYGAPGSGKSTTAKQVAEALSLPYGYISLNPQSPESRLIGFLDATGVFRDPVFYRLYKDGGVFCIDEMDNGAPALLTTLNSLLENGHGAFPSGIIERHKDFVLVATGNTAGMGANPQFPDRRPFDAAFRERFKYLEWDYDLALEKNISLSLNSKSEPWFNYIVKLREYCKTNYPRLVVSPRATYDGAAALLDYPDEIKDLLEEVLFKGFDKDSVKSILKSNPIPGGLKS